MAKTALSVVGKTFKAPKPIRRRIMLKSRVGTVSKHYVTVEHTQDPRQVILDTIGEINKDLVHFARILVAIYMPPMVSKTAGGVHLTDPMKEEDIEEFRWQGKVGLIVAMGPRAYVDDEVNKFEFKCKVGDWVHFRPSDGGNMEVNEVACRIFDNESFIRGQCPQNNPDYIW
jgi:co-chaperonin GroES (HSP10)